MPLRSLKLITGRGQHGRRLDDIVVEWLTEKLGRPVSKAKARKLIIAGVARVNGLPVRVPAQTLRSHARIDVSLDIEKLFADAPSRDKPFEVSAGSILYEDADIIVLDKPSGLPAHPTVDESRDNLASALTRFLRERDGNSNPYLGIHQRLDRDTSGVMLFTKTRRVNAAVGKLFSDHLVTKVYQAVTMPGRVPSPEWIVRNHLGKIAPKGKRARYGGVKQGEFAETLFRLVGEYPRGLWIEAIPKTGRTHQIRVHLAECRLPIIGDDLYGDERPGDQRLMLHASQLTFPHPITTKEIVVASQVPEDFQRCLSASARRGPIKNEGAKPPY